MTSLLKLKSLVGVGMGQNSLARAGADRRFSTCRPGYAGQQLAACYWPTVDRSVERAGPAGRPYFESWIDTPAPRAKTRQQTWMVMVRIVRVPPAVGSGIRSRCAPGTDRSSVAERTLKPRRCRSRFCGASTTSDPLRRQLASVIHGLRSLPGQARTI